MIIEAIITAVCLCADCFAVSTCSSTTLKSKPTLATLLKVSLTFAIIQAGLLLAGWLLGSLVLGTVQRFAHIIGGVLLWYVGGSMVTEGIRGSVEARNLNGWKNIILGGIATSIDALAVGGAESMNGGDLNSILPLFISVFVVTMLSVISGIAFGKAIGGKVGKWAEIAGGAVLVILGTAMMFS